MSNFHRIIGSLLMCVTVIVLCVFGLASDFVTSLLSSVDGLLLLMICLMMAAIFSVMLFVLAKESGMLPSHAAKPAVATASSKASSADEVQPNQATHPVVAQARPAAAPPAKPAPAPPAKIGEGK